MSVHKKISVFGILTFALCHAGVSAQAQSPLMPDAIGVPFDLDPVRNALISLDKEMATMKASSRALGYAGSTTRAELKGSRSGVRLSLAQAPEFIIRGVDPSRFKLYRLESKKGRRELQMASSGALGLHGKGTLEKSEIPLSIAEYGQMCYRLSPTVEISAGEYVISPIGSNDSFTFGVDVAQKRPSSAGISQATKGILDNEAIVALKQAGFSDDLILAKVRTSPGRFNLDPEDIIALKKQGVSESVILAMIEAGQDK